jgi:hypothetical protein
MGYRDFLGPEETELVDRLELFLGDRYLIRSFTHYGGRYSIEIVEGNNETVYRAHHRDLEHLCGMVVRDIIKDVNRPGRPDDVLVYLSHNTANIEDQFREMRSSVIKEWNRLIEEKDATRPK